MMLVIFTEEPSMKVFLETLIHRLYPKISLKLIAYQGKQDLEKNVARHIRNWHAPNCKFIVVHDQDSWDCVVLKDRLVTICSSAAPSVTVRIACHELESWYWGDLTAVSTAFSKPNITALLRKRSYRIADEIENPKSELKKYLPQYEQIAGAKAIAEHIDITRNTSHSFQVLFRTISEYADRSDQSNL
jgi:hypothetical protein